MKNKEFFEKYINVFLEQNSMLNLVSKNDAGLLWEKHIYDSLSIEKFFSKYINNLNNLTLLDIGTGGGFPSVPVALAYPQLEVYALDSIRKKLNAIENIKSELNITNLHTICSRAENISDKFDIITSRAVAPLSIIAKYAAPLLKNEGYFIAYKSIRAEEEIKEAKNIMKKSNLHVKDLIEYNLPLEENHVRKLIIITKEKVIY